VLSTPVSANKSNMSIGGPLGCRRTQVINVVTRRGVGVDVAVVARGSLVSSQEKATRSVELRFRLLGLCTTAAYWLLIRTVGVVIPTRMERRVCDLLHKIEWGGLGIPCQVLGWDESRCCD